MLSRRSLGLSKMLRRIGERETAFDESRERVDALSEGEELVIRSRHG